MTRRLDLGHIVPARAAGVGPYPAWLHRVSEFDPGRVLSAHDASVWEPA